MPGGATSINLPVSTLQDLIVEGDEQFAGVLTLPLSMPGIRLGNRDTATATIQDDDSKFNSKNKQKLCYSLSSAYFPFSCIGYRATLFCFR